MEQRNGMDKLVKILELLERKHLTEEEMKFISEAELHYPEVKEFISLRNNLELSFEHKLHQEPDLIADVVLFENGNDPSDNSVKYIYFQIKKHIESCERCKEEYNIALSEYCETRDYVKINLNKPAEEMAVKINGVFLFLQKNQFRYAFASLLVIIISYIGLYFYYELTIPPYKALTVIEESGELPLTRGRVSVLFQKSINAIAKKDFDTAIKYLKQDITENASDRSIFYSWYMLGIIQLRSSEEDFIGLVKNYNEDKVREAIYSFNKAISLNDSGDYYNLTLEMHYYLGKAFLLIDDLKSAEEHFSIVIKNKGGYSYEAEEKLKLMREYEK